LKPVPGATAIEVRARDGSGDVLLAAEIPIQSEEPVSILLRSAQGCWTLDSPGGGFLVMPPNGLPPQCLIDSRGDDADLVFLLDGTALADSETRPCPRLLEPAPQTGGSPGLVPQPVWRDLISGFIAFQDALQAARSRNLRSQALAFADEPPPDVRAPDLRSRYRVHPPERDRVFRRADPAALRASLESLPASSGGDPVDALAEALDDVAELNWRMDARHILLLCGQSPGYSIASPPPLSFSPDSFDCGIRTSCIEEAVHRLQAAGVLVMTLFLELPLASQTLAPEALAFLEWTRRQYHALASLPMFAFSSLDWDPARAAQLCLNPPSWIARGPAPGFLSAQGG
jgi:hypothetical protein